MALMTFQPPEPAGTPALRGPGSAVRKTLPKTSLATTKGLKDRALLRQPPILGKETVNKRSSFPTEAQKTIWIYDWGR